MDIVNSSEASATPYLDTGDDVVYNKVLEEFRRGLRKHDRAETVVLVALYVPVFTLALLGNTLVLIAVAQNKHMRNVTNFFIVNLTVADLTGTFTELSSTRIWPIQTDLGVETRGLVRLSFHDVCR